ncbi:MAG: phosphoribosylglycinamide formyltransferase [Actinomycetales bacterium]|nr:phosphoribosylglycinamide formyltransferase [Actinomycetales bacterium]
MLRLVVLISGGGSNLRALLEASRDAEFPARVVAIGADRDADGLAHAEEFGIPSFVVPFGAFPDRAAWGEELLAQLDQWDADLVILSGFMRLLPPATVRALGPTVLNTHPAYLPEFPGAHAVRDALRAGAEQTGASVILVDDGVDTGPVLAQERVPIHPGDSEGAVHDRIKLVERRLLVDVVLAIANGELDLAAVARAPRPETPAPTPGEDPA